MTGERVPTDKKTAMRQDTASQTNTVWEEDDGTVHTATGGTLTGSIGYKRLTDQIFPRARRLRGDIFRERQARSRLRKVERSGQRRWKDGEQGVGGAHGPRPVSLVTCLGICRASIVAPIKAVNHFHNAVLRRSGPRRLR